MIEVVLCAPILDRLVEHRPVRHPVGVRSESLVVGQVVALQDSSCQALPFAVVRRAQRHRLAVGGAIRPVRRHGR
jgi:hypothetical protein